MIPHLPLISPAPTSFFPSPSSAPSFSTAAPSLQAASTGLVPPEPLFNTYSREIAALLSTNPGGGGQEELVRYRQQEAARLLHGQYGREVRGMVEGVRAGQQQGGSYGGLCVSVPLSFPSFFSSRA